MLVSCMCVDTFAQDIKLRLKNVSAKTAIEAVQKECGYSFVYTTGDLDTKKKVSVDATNLRQAIDQIISDQDLSYEIKGNQVILRRHKPTNNTADQNTVSISGTVVDENGDPLIGANIHGVGNASAISDINGNFVISAPANSTLTVSYVGFRDLSVPVNNRSRIEITMKENKHDLDEIVVVGYGSMKKSDLTSSISSVGEKVIAKSASTNIRDVLQGRVPGMDIQSERYDGENREIFIRGSRSLNASNTPLTIVDGVPASLSDVNVRDIESIEVMKDAASAAIYGSQGANGVIIVTTKKGAPGKTKVSYDGYYTVNKPKFLNLMSGDRFVQMKRDAYLMNNGLWTPGNKGTVDDATLFTDSELEVIASGDYVDWFDLVYRDGSVISNSLAISGGNEKTQFNVSFRYDDTNGIVKTNNTKTFFANIALDHKVNNWMSIGAKMRYKNRSNSGFATYGQAIFYGTPVDRAYDADGKIIDIPNPHEGAYNILLNYEDGQYSNDSKQHNLNLLAYLSLKFTKDLSMHTNVSYSSANSNTGYFYGSDSFTSHGLNKSGRSATFSYQITANNALSYKHDFGKHGLTLDFIQEIQKSETESLSASGENQDVEYLKYFNLSTNSQNKDIGSGYSDWSMASLMGRVRYDYGGKYLANASIRYDGSSRLAKGRKWHSFISGGIAWRISSEDFMKEIDWINNLKLRLSYGEVGNQAIGIYQTIAQLGVYPLLFGEEGLYGYRPDNLVNIKLGWETSKTLNWGLDFGMFDYRLSCSIDYYKTKTSDLLMLKRLPVTSGFSRIYDNIGSTESQGIEATVNFIILNNKDFEWDAYANFAWNKNKITSLATKEDDLTNGWFVGKPISTIYDYEMEGIWQIGEEAEAAKYNCVPGDIKIKDQEGTSEGITADDKTFIGQSSPKFIASMGSNFKLKNLDF